MGLDRPSQESIDKYFRAIAFINNFAACLLRNDIFAFVLLLHVGDWSCDDLLNLMDVQQWVICWIKELEKAGFKLIKVSVPLFKRAISSEHTAPEMVNDEQLCINKNYLSIINPFAF